MRAETRAASSRMDARDLVIVRRESQLREMEGYLLSLDRDQPVVALTPALAPGAPVLDPEAARVVIGPEPRLYVIADDVLLDLQCLPGELALTSGYMARVWQPGLTAESDPGDHPLVRPLGTESPEEVLALQFDLSRPRVRKEIKRIEGIRAFIERQLDKAIQQITPESSLRSLPRSQLARSTRSRGA